MDDTHTNQADGKHIQKEAINFQAGRPTNSHNGGENTHTHTHIYFLNIVEVRIVQGLLTHKTVRQSAVKAKKQFSGTKNTEEEAKQKWSHKHNSANHRERIRADAIRAAGREVGKKEGKAVNIIAFRDSIFAL